MLKHSPLSSSQLAELSELLRIPSVSADPARAGDVRAAADWILAFIRGAGGTAELAGTSERPFVDGLIPASNDPGAAPLILCYGHFDVQPPAPLELWESEPFEPEVRDGWLYARGVADDKGGLWSLLRAAADLAADGELPVNVRFCCDSEEEVGGTAIVEFIEREAAHADACVIFDAPMLDAETPVFTIGTRGTLYVHVEVRTGAADLHSGMYGGAASERAARTRRVARQHPAARRPAARRAPDRRAPRRCSTSCARGTQPSRTARPSSPPRVLRRQMPPRPTSSTSAPGCCRHSTSTASRAARRCFRRRSFPATARANLSLRLAPGQTVGAPGSHRRGTAVARGSRGGAADGRGRRVVRSGTHSGRRTSRPARGRARSSARSASGRSSCAAAGRCRSCPRSSSWACPPSSAASPFPTATSTRRTSACSSRTSGSPSQRRASCSARSAPSTR